MPGPVYHEAESNQTCLYRAVHLWKPEIPVRNLGLVYDVYRTVFVGDLQSIFSTGHPPGSHSPVLYPMV
ncbi:hypothetical protein D3C72_2468120 [compost metagenome]